MARWHGLGAAAREWLAERDAELLPVPYLHVVFTLPAPIADVTYRNKAVIYDLLFKDSSEALLTSEMALSGIAYNLTRVINSASSR